MAIRASNKRTTPMQIEVLCPGAPPRVTSHHADYYEFYERALRGLRPIGELRTSARIALRDDVCTEQHHRTDFALGHEGADAGCVAADEGC